LSYKQVNTMGGVTFWWLVF